MKRTLALAVGLASAAAPHFAEAKVSCFPLAQIEQALGAEYGEIRQFAGREENGIEYRLYVNAKTGTWSWIGIPAAAEVGCLIFAGRSEAASSEKPSPPPQAHF